MPDSWLGPLDLLSYCPGSLPHFGEWRFRSNPSVSSIGMIVYVSTFPESECTKSRVKAENVGESIACSG